ncbi:DUF244 domain-containing protein, partial [Borreliella afzelii]
LEFVLKCEQEVFNLRNEIVKNDQFKLLRSNNHDNDAFIKLVEEFVVNSDFYQSGVEFDWVKEFVEYVECIDLEIKTDDDAANLECNLIEIDNLKVELNKIQNENKKREKPIKDLLKIKIDKILEKYPLIVHANYRFKEFVFNYDPKKRAISDRFKGLLPTSSKVFLPRNMSNIAYANSVPF